MSVKSQVFFRKLTLLETQPAIICSNLTTGTLEQGVKYVQN